MKKIIIFTILFSVMLSACIPANASSESFVESHENSEVMYFDDGSYMITTLTEKNIEYSQYNATRSAYIRTGTKTANYYSDDDELIWTYTLTGEFNVNSGISVVCTNVSASQTINSSSWGFYDENTYIEHQVARGKGFFKNKVLFVTVKTVEVDLFIRCDVNGNLS